MKKTIDNLMLQMISILFFWFPTPVAFIGYSTI